MSSNLKSDLTPMASTASVYYLPTHTTGPLPSCFRSAIDILSRRMIPTCRAAIGIAALLFECSSWAGSSSILCSPRYAPCCSLSPWPAGRRAWSPWAPPTPLAVFWIEMVVNQSGNSGHQNIAHSMKVQSIRLLFILLLTLGRPSTSLGYLHKAR